RLLARGPLRGGAGAADRPARPSQGCAPERECPTRRAGRGRDHEDRQALLPRLRGRETGPARARVLLDRRRRAGARERGRERLQRGLRRETDLGHAAAPGPDAARARRGAEALGPARTRIGLILGVLLAACAHKRVVKTPTPDDPGVLHHVLAGETLWRISRTYGVPLESLLRENDLSDPSHLSEGSLLFVPGATQELAVPPAGELPQARVEQRPRRGPPSLPRAG